MVLKKGRTREEIVDTRNLYILFAIFIITFVIFICYFSYSGNIESSNNPKRMSEKLLENKIVNNYYRSEDLYLPKELRYMAPSRETTLRIPILMYHYIENVKDKKDTIRIGLNTPPDVFEKQLSTLIDAKYTSITQQEIVDILNNRIDLPNNPIAITFDDGYLDFYTVAFPILKKYKIKATIYIIVDFLDYPNYMTKDQLREIADSDLIEIGSHSLNHIYLKTTDLKIAKNEIVESKKKLETYIQKRVKSFAYPYGAFNDNIAKLVEKAGYQSSVSVISGSNQSLSNVYYLHRLRPGFRTDGELIKFLNNSK